MPNNPIDEPDRKRLQISRALRLDLFDLKTQAQIEEYTQKLADLRKSPAEKEVQKLAQAEEVKFVRRILSDDEPAGSHGSTPLISNAFVKFVLRDQTGKGFRKDQAGQPAFLWVPVPSVNDGPRQLVPELRYVPDWGEHELGQPDSPVYPSKVRMIAKWPKSLLASTLPDNLLSLSKLKDPLWWAALTNNIPGYEMVAEPAESDEEGGGRALLITAVEVNKREEVPPVRAILDRIGLEVDVVPKAKASASQKQREPTHPENPGEAGEAGEGEVGKKDTQNQEAYTEIQKTVRNMTDQQLIDYNATVFDDIHTPGGAMRLLVRVEMALRGIPVPN